MSFLGEGLAGYAPSMTFISAGLIEARRNLMLRVPGGGTGREGKVSAERTEVGEPLDVYIIARFASSLEQVENTLQHVDRG